MLAMPQMLCTPAAEPAANPPPWLRCWCLGTPLWRGRRSPHHGGALRLAGSHALLLRLRACGHVQAVATAVATAIATAGIDCFVEGKGYACAYSQADIQTIASAHAKSFAAGYAGAISECDKCSSELEAITDSMASVVVEAASDAYNAACLGTPRNHHSILMSPGSPLLCIPQDHFPGQEPQQFARLFSVCPN